MELSKDHIVSKSFSKKIMGGLSEFEVRDFLHVLAEEIRHLRQKNSLQKKRLEDQENLIQDYKDREHILRESIASAEEWARKIRSQAEKNAALTLEKAQGKSEALVQEARLSLQNVYNDIADLKRLRLQFKTGLKAALQVQMELLDQEPIFSSGLPSDKKDLLAEKPLQSKGSFQSNKGSSQFNKEPLEGKEANGRANHISPQRQNLEAENRPNPSFLHEREGNRGIVETRGGIETRRTEEIRRTREAREEERKEQGEQEELKLAEKELLSLRESLKSLDESFT